MNDDSIPVVPHDDGIFEYQKELVHRQAGTVTFAKEVIGAYREKEQRRIAKLKRPVTMHLNIPLKVVMAELRKRAGEISAASRLHQFSTVEEHRNAKLLDAFIMHAEPVYESRATASKHHGDYCWKVALLNAFRILDLMKETSAEFPPGWVRVDVAPGERNFAALLSSAAFQMGYYYAKAQAMEKAVVAIRGKAMSQGKTGSYGALRQMIYSACAEIETRGERLTQKNVSGRVMSVLEEQNKGSTKGGLYRIFVEEGEKAVTSKELGKFIRAYRDTAR